MSQPAVACYITQPSNILTYLAAKLTANNMIAVNNLGYTAQLILSKLARLGHLLYASFI
jgi:hypothetical protein